MSEYLNILIVDASEIIREGLSRILSYNTNLHLLNLSSLEDLRQCKHKKNIRIVLLNPALLIHHENLLSKLKPEFQSAKWISIDTFFSNRKQNDHFDDFIYMNDPAETIHKTIEKHLNLSDPPTTPVPNTLTEREIDVLKLVVKGYTNNEVAKELFISIHTVNTHRKNISQKLGIKSAAGLAMYAVVNNIIEMSDYLK